MLERIYNENPNEKKIDKVVKCLQNGGVIIYPTDTVYGLGCDINNKLALERIARIKGIKLKNANFSIICFDLSNLAKYAKQINSRTFKLLKRLLASLSGNCDLMNSTIFSFSLLSIFPSAFANKIRISIALKSEFSIGDCCSDLFKNLNKVFPHINQA